MAEIWGAALGGLAIAGGSLLGSKSAAKKQKKAEKKALAQQQFNIDRTRDDNMPALEARNSALDRMRLLTQQFGTGPTMEEVMAEPGYEFGLKGGRDALESSAAARGGVYSGNAGRELLQFGSDYNTGKYGEAWTRKRANEGDAFDRERSIATGGQAGASTIAQAGQNGSNNISDILQNGANAQGAAAISRGNIISNAVNQGASWWNNRSQPSAGVAAATSIGNNNMPGTIDSAYASPYADGGPVRSPQAPASAPNVDPRLVEKYTERLNQLLAEQRAQQGAGKIAPTSRIELAEKKALGYAWGGRVGWGGPQQPMLEATGEAVQEAPQSAWPSRMGIQPTPPRYGAPQPAPGRAWSPPRPSRSLALADGGRVEPKPGTHAPQRRGGTGGGLNDLLAPPSDHSIESQGPPPVDFLNPRQVLQQREKRANFIGGGAATGGPPGRDTIPAFLDNGEHVVTSDEVTELGDGDNLLGQRRMAQFRSQLKGGARAQC